MWARLASAQASGEDGGLAGWQCSQSFIRSIMVTGCLLCVVVCPVAGGCGREGSDPGGAHGRSPEPVHVSPNVPNGVCRWTYGLVMWS